MKIKLALIFASLFMLQACGSKGMMYSENSIDKTDVAVIVMRS